jgi:O-antigen/teichoic acid export membrane protein
MNFALHQIDILRRLVSGSSWFAACTILQQGFGFLITLLVARILSPTEIGLIAIAWLTINAFDVFSRSGASDALIHLKEDPQTYLTTFFWIELIRGASLTTLGILTASPIASFFGEPEASTLIIVISFIPLVRALRSPSLVLFQRELRFRSWGKLMSFAYAVSFIISLCALFIWRTPVAYVISIIAGELITSLLSHLLFPFLPKLHFSLKSARYLLNYGRWLLGAGIVSYLAIYLDRYVIGTLGDAAILGIYAVAGQIG